MRINRGELDVNKTDYEDVTPLMLAVQHRYNYSNLVSFLVKKGAEINSSDKYGDTALHYAAKYGEEDNLDNIEFLIEKGANVTATNMEKETPLHKASSIEKVDLFIKHHADINAKDNKGYTPIQTSLLHNADMDIFKHFIEKGSDTNGLVEFIINTTSYDIRSDRNDYDEVWDKFEKTRLDLSNIAKDANKKGAWIRILC